MVYTDDITEEDRVIAARIATRLNPPPPRIGALTLNTVSQVFKTQYAQNIRENMAREAVLFTKLIRCTR